MASSVIGAQPEEEIIATVRAAYESGVNYFDMAGGHAAIFAAYGKALKGIRDKVYLQIHFGADYTSGEYGWTTDLDEVKKSVAWQLENLQTDYIDVGFIHCLDEESDLAAYQANGVLDCPRPEKAGRHPPYRPVLPYPGAGEQGAGYGHRGCGNVQHQSGL